MKKSLHSLLLCAALLTCLEAFSQTESTLYFMNSIPQVVEANPAIIPRYKTSIGLPFISSMGSVYTNNGFSYNDIITKIDGFSKIDLSNLSSKLAEKNYIQAAAFADLFRIGLRISPKVYLMASSTAKSYERMMIPKSLISLLADGTAPLVGSYSQSSPSAEANAMLVTSFGVAYQANDRLTVGGRLKYLIGQANVTTDASSLVVQVSDTYQITATGQATVKTSGVNSLTNSGYNASEQWTDYLKNNGWGLDLGATYKATDKLTLGASLTDIGFITWKNNTYQYTLDPVKATYTFSGIDINKLANNNTNYLTGQLDSIKNKFEMKETSTGSYTTMLPGKLYLSGKYEILKDLNVGLLFFSEKYKERLASGVTAAVNKNFGKLVSTYLSYTASNRSYNNIGLGVSFNVAPLQIYFVGDNIFGATTSLVSNGNLNSYLNSAQIVTVRAGLNIVMGWDKGDTKKTAKGESGIPRSKASNGTMKTTVGGSPNPGSSKSKKMKTTVGPSPGKSKRGNSPFNLGLKQKP